MASHDSVIRADDGPEVVTAEEITGDAAPHIPAEDGPATTKKPRNAFTELMSTKPKPKAVTENTNKGKTAAQPSSFKSKHFDARDGLGIYIEHPQNNPEGRVIDYDDDFVVIQDKYPKASVHLLLLPRDPKLYFQHPLEILSTNTTFLAKLKPRVERLKTLAAAELRRQYGLLSASDSPYQSALETLMSSPDPPSASERDAFLPSGRDWSREIIAGVHTHPSMNHLHVHVLSRDMHSPWMKHKKHYLSFTTSFLVGLEDFPLEEDSARLHPGDWPNWDMRCWRCGKDFGNKFAKLKTHLDEEFETWKRE
ncbi:HIT-like protein, partial [Bimuria novae-zelandiae CBS 107.79]